MKPSSLIRSRNRGAAIVYCVILMVVLTAFVSLGVDLGRVQLAKLQLQTAADNAALYGAGALASGVSAVQARITTAAADNKVDGAALTIDTTNDLEFGVWDPSTKTFNVLTGTDRTSATAIRVTARRTNARGTGVPLFFSSLIGRSNIDVTAVAIATRGRSVSATINADACPWLAGEPNGTKCDRYGGNSQDSIAPAQSPYQVTSLPLVAGSKIYFRQSSGTTAWADGSGGTFGPDGDTTWIVAQNQDNGINTTKAPIQCMVGIFLDNRQPDTYAAASQLDFTTPSSRDFTNLSPAIKQVFFIGDGLNSSGQLQSFTVPTGATRLYLGLMDEKGWWWDNYGTVSTMLLDSQVQLVK